jgi:osmotically-inducible protein OsmY
MSTDHQLQTAVQAELHFEPSIDAAHIGVTAENGVVTLTGHVPTYAQKRAAERAALEVKGVKAVVERIEVRLGSHSAHGDDQIAAAAARALEWDVSIPRNAVHVKVERGAVVLSGTVDWNYEREAAEHALHRLPGVVSVTNAITLRPRVNTQLVRDDIVHALHRSWFFDPQTIEVTAEGGRVRLTGTVRSPHERAVAARTAWSEPGVTDVVNDLTVV